MYHIAIVDDEENFRNQISEYLSQFSQMENVSMKVSTFSDGAEICENYEPCYDMILLDIEMPGMNGMDAARKIREVDEEIVIVFITNMASFAINGYEVGALDFVMKPITYPAFAMRFSRALKRVSNKQQEKILLNLQSGQKPLELSEILYIEIQGRNLTYHTTEGDFVVKGTLAAVEEEMRRYPFAKASNWYLVNLTHVKEVQGNQIVVAGQNLDMSRRCKPVFLKALAEYIGG